MNQLFILFSAFLDSPPPVPPRVPKWPSQPSASVLKTTPSSSLSDGSTASLRSAASGGTQIRSEAGATPNASEERQKLVAERYIQLILYSTSQLQY